MTLRGKNNHYDIKVLSGYGCGVSISGQKLILKNGIDVFTKKQETEKFIPVTVPYSRIVICGNDEIIS
ncbi:hypothetical protein [Nitrosopumilus sp.]|uniref:hypothetical protein n=1 Tax=Nitrosopumilus sp. TaxID=2024843 RepID=UPI00247DCB28|nr:hypothetical protein [Nitrosopumilus sp.]MCV0410702.1 hypothetical protein [Nitrosopumilus sp.]